MFIRFVLRETDAEDVLGAAQHLPDQGVAVDGPEIEPRAGASGNVARQIVDVDGGRPLLFAAKDEVDPFVQVLRHVVAFQGGPVQADEFAQVMGRSRKVTGCGWSSSSES